jgi:hypothetical protein
MDKNTAIESVLDLFDLLDSMVSDFPEDEEDCNDEEYSFYLMAETVETEEIPIAVALLRWIQSDCVSRIISILINYYFDNRDSWEEDLYI